MDKDIIGIQCDCNDNPDLDGYWERAHLEEECEYLDMPKSEWMSHLFGHLFVDYSGWNSKLEDAFITNDNLVQMKLLIGFYTVVITKVYK